MSAAIATASRDDRPSSTIGVASSIASGDWPVALATQLRSHCRTSAMDISVRAEARLLDFEVVRQSCSRSVGLVGEGVRAVVPLRRLPSM